MSDFVTLDEGKTHLRITGATQDAEVQALLDTAEGIVLQYIDYSDYDAFNEANGGLDDYWAVEAAVKLVLTNLYDKRDEDPLSAAAMNLLRRHRAPKIG